MEESTAYYELIEIIEQFNPELKKGFHEKADKKSNYFKLFISLEQKIPFRELSKQYKDKRALDKELYDLADEIVKKTMDEHDKLSLLRQVEQMTLLGMHRKALSKAEALEKLLNNDDYWIKWRLSEIKLKILPYADKSREKLFNVEHLQQVARSYIHFNEQAFQKPTDQEMATEFYQFIFRFKQQAEQVNETVRQMLDNLKGIREKTQRWTFIAPSSFNIEKHDVYIAAYFKQAFELLDYIIKNQLFVQTYYENNSEHLLREIAMEAQSYRQGSDQLIPNALTVYSEYLMTSLKSALLLLNNGVKSTEWGDAGDLNEVNVEDISTRISILKTISRIFVYDQFHDKTHLRKIFKVWEDVKELLNKKKEHKLSLENELGLKCLYVQLVRMLRENASAVKAEAIKYKSQIIDNSGTEGRYVTLLSKYPVYKKALNFKGLIEYSEASNFMQLAIIKLHNLSS